MYLLINHQYINLKYLIKKHSIFKKKMSRKAFIMNKNVRGPDPRRQCTINKNKHK